MDYTIYANYVRSLRIMGVALLVLAANYYSACSILPGEVSFVCGKLAMA